MKIKIKILLLFLVIGSTPISAQMEELALLGGLAGAIPDTGTIVEDDPEREAEEIEDEIRPKDRKDFTDNEYGFTGGKNFNNPPKSKFSDQPLEYFGYNYFIDQPTTFAPLENVPIPPDYLIGPDDFIKIILFGNTNKKYELKVTRDGDIFIPEIGPISVAGLTFEDLKELVQVNIANQFIGTQVTVTLGSLRSINIFVLGAASKPGMYSISALSTLTNAIIKSGGIDITGSLRDIKLKRNGETVTTFDFYDLLLNGDTSGDIRLMQGDVIFIETIGKTVAINGEVNRPAIYELKDNENLNDLLNYAGNFKPKANLSSSEITRISYENNSFDLLPIDLKTIDSEQFFIQNGDVLTVYPVVDNLKKAVLVKGHAQQPGFYAWNDGMRIGEIFNDPDDLLEMTDLNYVLIKRKNVNSQTYSFLQVDLEYLFKNRNSEENILLYEEDEIILFPSMLSPEQITTTMIQDEYEVDEDTNQLVLKDEWTSITYLRKSLMEETLEIEEQNRIFDGYAASAENDSEIDIRRYYEYSIYDYCTIPEDLAIIVVEQSGFRAKKSIPVEDLEGLKSPEDFIFLQQTLERERIKLQQESDGQATLTSTITNLCRQQLLRPVIDIIERNDVNEILKMVSVFGNVHFPGSYPLTNGMILSDAIKAAGGPKNATYTAEIELSRRDNIGKKFATTNNYASIEEANEISLQEMDTINLKQIASDLKTVEILGEVFFPGTYPISENQTLGELVKRAGGLTEFGYPEAAFFQRNALKQAELERLSSAQNELKRKILLSSQSGGLGQASLDSSAINQLTALITGDTDESGALGRLVIDLKAILSNKVSDIILEDGDKINIPKQKQSISVIGEVFVANSHIFDQKLNINDYINLSGGTTTFADQQNIYLIKSDGSIVSPSQLSSGFFRSGSSSLKPGDTIVVPLQVQPFSGIKATTEITQIIYQMALAAAAVNSF